MTTSSNGNQLVQLSKATQMLAEAKSLNEVKKILDIAEAARVYARAAKLGLEAYNHAAEVKVRAERKAGEMLVQLERKPGQRTDRLPDEVSGGSEYRQVLREQGIQERAAERWQQLASLPERKFEEHIEESRGERPITTSGLVQEIRNVARQNDFAVKARAPMLTGARTFPIVYADPPWRYEHSETHSRKIENQYPTMGLEEIRALPLGVVASENCLLFLWATSPKLHEAMGVIDAWGFDYRTCMVWIKDKIGMGYYARQRHELLLIAKQGEIPPPLPADRPDSVISAPRGKHSEKPEEVYEIIERMYPKLPKIELFCRKRREGWEAWGNEGA